MAPSDGCEELEGADTIAEGAAGERFVRPPHAERSSDTPSTTNRGSFMGAVHCSFRSG